MNVIQIDCTTNLVFYAFNCITFNLNTVITKIRYAIRTTLRSVRSWTKQILPQNYPKTSNYS